ncbi:pirin family protein [Blastococcus brunescens]|uniref:Pirin family protein n=1 Tax=Blastococcus brunescens TaxID=1564165 RepID=A0ABZ1B7X5_9ACTN|nr:pirin family protein [Blastococcus sp. BMG 8361]WRL66912.1 pirin family protein [Blastococcus sp. BMG 8361]
MVVRAGVDAGDGAAVRRPPRWAGGAAVSGLVQRVVLAPEDGSLGPLLRVADDRLDPHAGYGRHEHRAVDVVAIVLAGSLRHRWEAGAEVAAGDVAVLRAGAGLEHDEVAGADGARVLQCYLRSADPGAVPGHAVHRAASGWVDLARPDARLWVGRAAPGEEVAVPAGLLVLRSRDGVVVEQQTGRTVAGPGALLVWQLDTTRPAWAES